LLLVNPLEMSHSDLTPDQLAHTLAGEPPPGVIPNLDNLPSSGYLLFTLGGVGVAVMLVVASLRFYARIVIRKVFKAEDCMTWSLRITQVASLTDEQDRR
jgi:hypothetical protein